MTVSVIQVVSGAQVSAVASTVTSTLANPIVAGDIVVALVAGNVIGGNHTVDGLGAAWTRVAKDSQGPLDLWVGVGATSTGTVTATQTAAPSGDKKHLNLWHVRGTTATFVGGADNATGTTLTSAAMTVGLGQIFIGSGYAETSGNTFNSPNPSSGWVNTGDLVFAATRLASRVYRIPTASESHYFSTVRAGTTHPIVRVVLGDVAALGINSAFAGEGTLATSLSTSGVALPTVKGTYGAHELNATDPAMSLTLSPPWETDDVMILVFAHGSISTTKPSAVSGLGATWVEVAENITFSVWKGTGATSSSGVITATDGGDTNRAAMRVYHLSGVSGTTVGVSATGAGTQTTPAQIAGPGQVVIAGTFTDNSAGTIAATEPVDGWSAQSVQQTLSTRYVGMAYRVPTASESHSISATRDDAGSAVLIQVTVGDVTVPGELSSAFAGAGVLATTVVPTTPTTGFEQRGLVTPFTTLAEGNTYLAALAAAYPNVSVESVGTSPGGNDMRMVRVGPEVNDRYVLYVAQQHGIELAGRDALFTLLRTWATSTDPDILAYLSTTTILAIPTAHPDNFTVRNNANGINLNRDHIELTQDETKAIHAVIAQYRPEVIIDMHEGTFSPNFATAPGLNQNADAGILTLSDELNTAVGSAITASGKTWEYYESATPSRGPEYLNHSSVLGNSISVLLESRYADVAVTRYNTHRTAVDAITAWDGANHVANAVVIADAKANVAARNGTVPFDLVFDTATTGTVLNPVPKSYTLTTAQHTATATLRDRFNITSVPVGANFLIEMNQESQPVIPYILDTRSALGTVDATANYPVHTSTAFSGAGALDTEWKDYRNLYSNFSGSGALSTVLGRLINSGFTGSGVLSTDILNKLRSDFTGSGTLSTYILKTIRSNFSGAGTLTTGGMIPPTPPINSEFTGGGVLGTALALTRRFTTHYGSEGVLFTELGYVVTPAPLGTSPLGKLSSFSVNTAAVPANPSEGSGSTPSVSASYTKGLSPEFALGETNVLKNGAIGTYAGEIVSVTTSAASAVARISMDTLLTPLNVDLSLFPFIDGVPGLWTAARALDYWTQQCGVFYDQVPGEVIAYASGFGHTDAFGASTTARFYERLVGGATTTQVVNGRSVKTLGSAGTGTTAFHELPKGAVAVSLPKSRKLVFSTGLGLLGTGRTATVRWNFLDSKDVAHEVSLEATSAGSITAKIGATTVASASVPAGATYRLALSLERLSSTALVAKLTVHTDDLAGAGTLAHDGSSSVVDYALPGVMRLTSLEHVSAGGSGAQMTRWGAYLTVAESHPMELPAVQKVLGETKKPFGFVSGFEGNVWNLLNEFCSIAKLDVRFLDGALHVSKRTTAISAPGISWSQFEVTAQRREKYKQVAVVNKQSKAVATDDAVLWRADSVFSVAAREVFETTVQTPHSILNVVQPVAVNGILPFPYIQGGGQYVVTGADGYIVAPAWWNDNGGKVEVSLTGKEGEIAIKITAPTQDTVRAPYRISEGAADRPALYVCGSGILNDPKEVHVNTGAKNAREGFDSVFESPFIAGVRETYDTAAAMAHEYSASVAEVQYSLPNDFETPTGLGQYPAGTLVTDNSRNFRIMDASQTHSKVSGNAVPHTTIGAYVASYPEGATIRDEKARHAGRTIRKFNIKPLKGDA